ncbi:MAG: tetratricopeptide repeat protein [Deltaproteobacteria bacterium]|nr:tetratricopeptide repeat protein [Candidatus Zymogenaceae bacterium]
MTNSSRTYLFTFFLAVMLLVVSCTQDPMESQYRRGEALFEKGEFSSAVEVYRKIATYTPDSSWAPEALYQSGLVNYLYLKEYEEAVDDFAHLIYYYPKNKNAFDAQAKIVEIYVNKLDDPMQAIVELRKLIEKYPNRDGMDQYQYMLAQCFFQLRDFDQVRLEYLILLDSYPNSELVPEVYYNIASTYFIEGGGKLEKAVEYYQRVIDEFPESEYVHDSRFYIAAAAEEAGDLEEAKRLYEELLPTYPSPRVVELRIEGINEIQEKMASPAPEKAYRGFSELPEKRTDKDADEEDGDDEWISSDEIIVIERDDADDGGESGDDTEVTGDGIDDAPPADSETGGESEGDTGEKKEGFKLF